METSEQATSMMPLTIDGRNADELDNTARAIMGQLTRKSSEKYPSDTRDFYSYKYVSMEAAVREVGIPGDWAQFGVYKGTLAKLMLEGLPFESRLHLFDSFEGLPEDWISGWRAGAFALPPEEVPTFSDRRVRIHQGWFSDTVPAFMNEPGKTLAFVHIDCDLYRSAVECLHGINNRITPGTILLFDEYMMMRDGEFDDGEHRALIEWLSKYDRKIEYLWRTDWVQVAVRVVR